MEKKEDDNLSENHSDNKLILNLIKSSWNILGIDINYKDIERLFVEAGKLCETTHGIS